MTERDIDFVFPQGYIFSVFAIAIWQRSRLHHCCVELNSDRERGSPSRRFVSLN